MSFMRYIIPILYRTRCDRLSVETAFKKLTEEELRAVYFLLKELEEKK